jgi:hypothetical protein
MKYDLSGTPENLKFFDDVVKELGNIAMNTATSAVADGAATNRKLAEFLMQTRALVVSIHAPRCRGAMPDGLGGW